MDVPRFVREHSSVASPPLCPELRLRLAIEITPLWTALEEAAGRTAPPPFWAFAWPGGQALARLFLDRPELVRGKAVLDFGSGSGLVAIAAVRAGAARAVAADVDPCAAEAARTNADLNGLAIETEERDLVGDPLAGFDLVAAGDMCYEQPLAGRVLGWFAGLAAAGRTVLLGDPGRTYAPTAGIEEIARYAVSTSLELEDRTVRDTVIWRVSSDVGGRP
jgi:predicted nicotinamide N-methyase